VTLISMGSGALTVASRRPFAPGWPAVMPAAGHGRRVLLTLEHGHARRRVFSSHSLASLNHGRHGCAGARAGTEHTQGLI
jgi:hypothetical protein